MKRTLFFSLIAICLAVFGFSLQVSAATNNNTANNQNIAANNNAEQHSAAQPSSNQNYEYKYNHYKGQDTNQGRRDYDYHYGSYKSQDSNHGKRNYGYDYNTYKTRDAGKTSCNSPKCPHCKKDGLNQSTNSCNCKFKGCKADSNNQQ